MKRQGSGLVTPIGLAALGVSILVTAYLNIVRLAVFLTAVLLLCLAAFFWAKYALSHIVIDVGSGEHRAFPGQELELKLHLQNAKFLPVAWLELGIPVNGGCIVSVDRTEPAVEPETKTVTAAVPWVLPWQRVCLTPRIRAARRGVCDVHTAELWAGDMFGLSDRRRSVTLDTGARFVVYPTVFPVDPAALLKRMRELEPHRRGLYSDNTLLRSVRDYREGDSVRAINWRMLARQDKVQVNIHETLDMRRMCLIPDLESFTYTEVIDRDGEPRKECMVDAHAMEHMLSLIASVILAADAQGAVCTLAVPSVPEGRMIILIPQSRDTQVPELLTALAEISYQGEETRWNIGLLQDAQHRLGQIFLFTKYPPEPDSPVRLALDGLAPIYVVQDSKATAERTVIFEKELTVQ